MNLLPTIIGGVKNNYFLSLRLLLEINKIIWTNFCDYLNTEQ